MQLNELTIEQAQAGLRNGDYTAVEITEACLNAIHEKNGELNAVLTVCADEALAAAKAADKKLKKGEALPLTGIPYLAKDNILTKGVRTTAGSKMLDNYIAPFDATIIARLREQGAVLLGKTNLDEFAHGGSTENSAFGPTKNPLDTTRVPGGSSGGSAAAVTAHVCLFALGTDTGGSIRNPASFCGTVGLKPTYGRNSRFGIVAMTSSTDSPGPITKTCADAQAVQAVIAGHDPHDFTTAADDVDARAGVNTAVRGKTIGVPHEYFVEGMEQAVADRVRAAIAKLKAAGATIVDVSLPHTKYAIPAYYIITPSEISSNLGRYDGIRYGASEQDEAHSLLDIYLKTRGRNLGPEVKRRIMLGTYALSAGYYDAYYLQAQKVRTKIIADFTAAFQKVDALVTPVTPTAAFTFGARQDPLSMYLEDVFTLGASLAGLPAVSVPYGTTDDTMPVGVQVIGKRLAERDVLGIGAAIMEY